MPPLPNPVVLPETDMEQELLAGEPTAGSHLPGSFRDVPISSLSAEERRLIDQTAGDDWFHSLSFAGTYCFPPAERVCFLTNPQGKVVEACFYREVRRWRVLEEIHVQGRVAPGSSVVRHLIETRKPALIHIPWLRGVEIQNMKALKLFCSARQSAEDFLIQLPSSHERYLKNLGSSARKHLPYYVRRVQREWGDAVSFVPLFGSQVTRELYHELLDLNRKRMRQRHRETAWLPQLAEHRWPIVQERGLLYGVYTGKKLVAGTLSFLQAGSAYLIVLSHDPEFDRLNLGSVALWLTLKHLIGMQLKCFHLMWGTSFYKAQFGGKVEPLFRATGFANPILAGAWHAFEALRIPALVALAGGSVRRLSWEKHDPQRGSPMMLATELDPLRRAVPEFRGFPVALLNAVVCPNDGQRFAIVGGGGNEFVSEATVRCVACGSLCQIHAGILRLLPLQEPLSSVTREEQNARDRGADRYDAHFSEWSNAVEMGAVFADDSLFRGKTVLDLACGTGRMTVQLLGTANAVLAADFSEQSLLNLAKKATCRETRLGLVWCDVTQFVLTAAFFDTVISAQLLEHIPSKEQRGALLDRVHTGLKPSGALLITAYHYNFMKRVLQRPPDGFHANGIFFHRFTCAELADELSAFVLPQGVRPLQIDPHVFPAKSSLRGWLARIMEPTVCTRLLGQLVFTRATKQALTQAHQRPES
jgi:ubiquinone/menaquinone biosynthesis C-methylase UbiE